MFYQLFKSNFTSFNFNKRLMDRYGHLSIKDSRMILDKASVYLHINRPMGVKEFTMLVDPPKLIITIFIILFDQCSAVNKKTFKETFKRNEASPLYN